MGLKLLVGPLRKWDYKAAQRPDVIIANSTHIKEQIQRYYDRAAAVICPPVDTAPGSISCDGRVMGMWCYHHAVVAGSGGSPVDAPDRRTRTSLHKNNATITRPTAAPPATP